MHARYGGITRATTLMSVHTCPGPNKKYIVPHTFVKVNTLSQQRTLTAFYCSNDQIRELEFRVET